MLELILLAFVGVPLAVVLLAVVLGVCLTKRDRRVLLSAVCKLGCPSCAASLSEASIRLADELWGRHVATLMQRNPGVMLRLVRKLAVVCVACGARLQFDQDSGTLHPISVVLSFETAEMDSRCPTLASSMDPDHEP